MTNQVLRLSQIPLKLNQINQETIQIYSLQQLKTRINPWNHMAASLLFQAQTCLNKILKKIMVVLISLQPKFRNKTSLSQIILPANNQEYSQILQTIQLLISPNRSQKMISLVCLEDQRTKFNSNKRRRKRNNQNHLLEKL